MGVGHYLGKKKTRMERSKFYAFFRKSYIPEKGKALYLPGGVALMVPERRGGGRDVGTK